MTQHIKVSNNVIHAVDNLRLVHRTKVNYVIQLPSTFILITLQHWINIDFCLLLFQPGTLRRYLQNYSHHMFWLSGDFSRKSRTIAKYHKQANFKKILIPRPACDALSVTALVGLVTLTFDLLISKYRIVTSWAACVMGFQFHPVSFWLLSPFRSRVRSRHATDRRTDRHRPPFHNAEVGHNKYQLRHSYCNSVYSKAWTWAWQHPKLDFDTWE